MGKMQRSAIKLKAGLELQFQACKVPRLGTVGANPRGHVALGSQQPPIGRKRGSVWSAEPRERGLGLRKWRLLRLTATLDDRVLVVLCLYGGEAMYVSVPREGRRCSAERAH